MKKVMLVFGTRPEAIKMCPLVKELKKHSDIQTVVCVTGQHREMLKQVLHIFDVVPDYDLDIMKPGQDLFDITVSILEKIKVVLKAENPDLVLVHGDTSTSFVTALACFYLNIKVGHVEAGLRTHNLLSPFPEEFNRRGVGIIADLNFSPTQSAANNLITEGNDKNKIFITGNTVIDALKTTVKNDYKSDVLDWAKGSKLIILTAHRRENFGEPMRCMFKAVKRIADEFSNVKVVYPMHMNPKVREIAHEIFDSQSRVKLIEPLDAIDFHNFMERADLILTDSGGIQEEAPSLGKPVLVLRDTTERPEGVEVGTLKLVGTREDDVYYWTKVLLTDMAVYDKMSKAINPYGDGHACERIVDIIKKYLGDK